MTLGQSCSQGFLKGLISPSSNAWTTRRNCVSSQPISTASSSASCAMSRSSARFSFSTLIFSTQETGSPSGVRHTVPVSDSLLTTRPPSGNAAGWSGDALLWLVGVAIALLLLALAEDVLADQVFKAHRRLGELDDAAGLEHVVGSARHDGEKLVAEQPARQDLGHRVARQLDRRIDAHLDDGEEGRRIEGLRDDAADLDAADPDVTALANPLDAVELRGQLITRHRTHLAGAVGEEEKDGGDDQHHGA